MKDLRAAISTMFHETMFHGILRGIRKEDQFFRKVEDEVKSYCPCGDITNPDIFRAIANVIGDLIEADGEDIPLHVWLDSIMGAVESYHDVLSYLPWEWDENAVGNPYHIWTERQFIHCENEVDAELVCSWLNNTLHGTAQKEYEEDDWVVWFETADNDEEGGDQ